MGSPGRLPKKTPIGASIYRAKDNKEMSASESASRSYDPASLTHDLPIFRTRTLICPAELCAGPHYPNTPHSQSHRSLHLTQSVILYCILICFRSSMAPKANPRSVSFVPLAPFPQFPSSPLLNWLAKRHQFTAFVPLF